MAGIKLSDHMDGDEVIGHRDPPKKKVKSDLLLKGKIVFEFLEDPEGTWFSKVTPVMLPAADIRDTYKLALMVAVLQDTCSKKLDVIDKLIKEKAVLEEMEKPDTEKYQQPLPFKEDKNAI